MDTFGGRMVNRLGARGCFTCYTADAYSIPRQWNDCFEHGIFRHHHTVVLCASMCTGSWLYLIVLVHPTVRRVNYPRGRGVHVLIRYHFSVLGTL